MKLLLFILLAAAARADQVIEVKPGQDVRIPYCGGTTRLTCDGESPCAVEFVGGHCATAAFYAASTFYPSAWTVLVDLSGGGTHRVGVDPERVDGLEEPYFFVFLHDESNSSYAKLRYHPPPLNPPHQGSATDGASEVSVPQSCAQAPRTR